jgi:hypothetical protein
VSARRHGFCNATVQEVPMTTQIPRERWSQFLDRFSREHSGAPVRVEVLRGDLGAQLEVRSLRLNGITAEADVITIAAGDSPEDHVGHVIARPTKVMMKQRSGHDEVLEIEAADRSTTLVYLI